LALERTILASLIHNEQFTKRAATYIKLEYFSDPIDRALHAAINSHLEKYGTRPTVVALRVDLSAAPLDEETHRLAQEALAGLTDERVDLNWLIDQTERFCQDRAIYNGIKRSISILDGDRGETLDKGAIPDILRDALAVSFDVRIGHDFIEDAEPRFDYYRSNVARIQMDIALFNRVTGGGTPRKTLNVLMGGVHVGKSLFLCHMSAANLLAGLNVLYVTLELAEEEVARRIDANLLDVPIAELGLVPRSVLINQMSRLRAKTTGKLVIKEYPTSCAGAGQFRHLLHELKTKRSFVPDVVYVDYLNICCSSRIKLGAAVNSYTFVKAIAEELRGLAVEYNVPLWTATQTTREGFKSSDLGMENVAESFGLPATADFMAALIGGEELERMNQILVKQLKNRYTDAGLCRRFVVGVDRTRMRLYDVSQHADEDKPVFDETNFGELETERGKKGKKYDFSAFS